MSNLKYYSANQVENYYQELNAKTLLGAKRECNSSYDAGSVIELVCVDMDIEPEHMREYTPLAIRYAYTKKWTEV